MFKNITKIKNVMGVALVTLLSTLVLNGGVYAYGPERATFTANSPADYVTFNSITDNTDIGDERNFVRIREVGAAKYVDSATIVPGKEYEVFVYFHNNAKPSLNATGKGIALNTKMSISMPASIKRGATANLQGKITSSNSSPLSVWDHVSLSSPQGDVVLRYINGTAKVTSKGAVNGRILDGGQLFGEGALLGYSAMNGAIPGCDEYIGSVTFRFTSDFADFDIQKTVSESGKNNWVKEQSSKVNGKVNFKVAYKNTGTMTQENVNVLDTLPKGLSYVKGSTKLFNREFPSGKQINDDVVVNGINVGHYAMGAEFYIVFSVTVDNSMVCGLNKLTNSAQIRTANGNKTDTATVTVQKDCTPKQVEEFCTVPGKGNLKKDDPNCVEKCTTPGKEHLNKNDPNCTDKCKVPGLEHLNANDKNCVEIPSELPQTGPAEAAAMIIAVVALTSGIAYYMRSRQELKNATAENGNIKAKITSAIDKIKSKISKK